MQMIVSYLKLSRKKINNDDHIFLDSLLIVLKRESQIKIVERIEEVWGTINRQPLEAGTLIG